MLFSKNFLRSSSEALLTGLAQRGFALIHFLVLVRWLSPAAFGEWTMLLTLITFVEMGRLGLVQNGLLHYTTHQPEERAAILSSSLVLTMLISSLGMFLCFNLAWILRGVWQMYDLPILLLLHLPVTLLIGVARFYDSVDMINHRFRTSLITAGVSGGLYLLATVLYYKVFHTLPLWFLVVAQIPVYLLTVGAAWLTVGNSEKLGKVSKKWLLQLFEYGRYGLGTNLLSQSFQRIDVLLLGAFVSPASIGAYNVATRIVTYLDFPLNMIGLALFPHMATENFERGTEGVIGIYEKSVTGLLALTLPATILIFWTAPQIIAWATSGQFGEAALLLQILILASIIKPWGRLFGVVLDAVGKPEWNFRSMLMGFVMAILLNALLIPRWGVEGAAWASTIAVWFSTLIGQYVLQLWLPINNGRIIRNILKTYRFVFFQIDNVFSKKM